MKTLWRGVNPYAINKEQLKAYENYIPPQPATEQESLQTKAI
jgi:hypothetical protein